MKNFAQKLILSYIFMFNSLSSMESNVHKRKYNNIIASDKNSTEVKKMIKLDVDGLLGLPVEIIISILYQGMEDIIKKNDIFNPFEGIKNFLAMFYQINRYSRDIILENQNYLTSLAKFIAKQHFAQEYTNFSKKALNERLHEIVLGHINNKTQEEAAKLIISGANPDMLITYNEINLDGVNSDSAQEKYIERCPLIVYICKFSRFLKLLDLFKNYKVDINAKSYNGITALIAAINSGLSENIIAKLISLKPNFNTQDNWGRKALSHAVSKNNSNIVKLLLNAGAEFNDDIYLHHISNFHSKNALQIFDMLIKKGINLNLTDAHGNTALISIISRCRCYNDIIKKLIESGIDVNIKNLSEQSALNMEVSKPTPYLNEEIIEALIKAGADVNAIDNKGKSILQYALLRHQESRNKVNLRIINLLKKFGAKE